MTTTKSTMTFVRSFALIAIAALTLSACGGLTAESAKEKLLVSQDFTFDVEVENDPTLYTGSDQDEFFEGDCSRADSIASTLADLKTVAATEFTDRNDSQNGFRVTEYVIDFKTEDAAVSFVSEVEKGAKDSDCEFYYSDTQTGPAGTVFGKSEEDFTNFRTTKDAFGVATKQSVAWDIKKSDLFIGGLYSDLLNGEDEGGRVVAAVGNFVIIFDYYVKADDIDEVSDPVTRSDLEEVIAAGLKRLVG